MPVNRPALLMLVWLVLSPVLAWSQERPGELLGELDLSESQKAAIHRVLLGGMQSLQAIKAEIKTLEQPVPESSQAPEAEEMRRALAAQRMHLAEAMVLEILDVLSDEQIAKLNFGALLESMQPDADEVPEVRELEI